MQWRAWAMVWQDRNKMWLLPAATLFGHYQPWLGAHSRLLGRDHPANHSVRQLGIVTPGAGRTVCSFSQARVLVQETAQWTA